MPIPDEVEQMQGDNSEDNDIVEIPVRNEVLDSGSKYIYAILRDQSESLYLQRDAKEYFDSEQDMDFRANFVWKCYGGGLREIEVDGVLVRARTDNDGMHIKVTEPAEAVLIELTWEQVAVNIDQLIQAGTYVNPNTPAPYQAGNH